MWKGYQVIVQSYLLEEEMNRLREKYEKEIKEQMKTEFAITNVLSIPRLKKVVINMGLADAKDSAAVLEKAITNLTAITGQKPVVTKAKKSIAAFKLVQGNSIGLMVTLRGERMYDFLDKLFSIVLPKVRDFRGVSTTAFDGRGNYNLGLREMLIFPEIDYRNIDRNRGMQVTINTSAVNNEQSRKLLELMGMPFRKEAQS